MIEFKNKKIAKAILYAQDIVKYVQNYMEIMDSYYQNMDNQCKDKFTYKEYINFKKECEKGAKERGLMQ